MGNTSQKITMKLWLLTTIFFLIFSLGCTAEGLHSDDGGVGVGAGGSGPIRGSSCSDASDTGSIVPDALIFDVQLSDLRAVSPDLSPGDRSPIEVGAEAAADLVSNDVQPEQLDAGREVSRPEAGPELQVSPDLRPVLPEAGPEAKKCAPECNTGCNVGCRADGQCQACTTCTCEAASGTCHC
jgi:hypothetical protein